MWEKEWTEAGRLAALFDTVRLSQVNGLALPEWCAAKQSHKSDYRAGQIP